MAQDWYTPQELAQLNAINACPYWQRMTPTGWCVERWWSGGPVSTATNALFTLLGLSALGLVFAYASKFTLLKPALQLLRGSRGEMKTYENPRRWRTRRRRRRAR